MAEASSILKRPRKSPSRFRSSVAILGILLALLMAISYGLWRFSPGSSCRILVLDKTVPHPDYREHHGLFWVLNHAKVFNKGGERRWRNGKDYVGFYPEKFIASDAPFASDLKPEHLIGINLLYIADTYGVYTDDYRYPEKFRTHLDFSRKIFGGLTAEEADLILRYAEAGGDLIAEFNTFHQPTSQEIRSRLEPLFGLEWSGWTGRYFKDLANAEDVPAWAHRYWKAHHGTEWKFSGPGFIMAHADSRILVLEEGKDLAPGDFRLRVTQPEDPLMKGVSENVPYRYWFDIVRPVGDTEVLAWYAFRLTSAGKDKLRAFGLPTSFPAVLRSSLDPLRVYFAGDFSDSRLFLGPHFLAGWARLRRILCTAGKARSQNAFFWRFYLPLLENLFRREWP
ncbi:MAG: hypothetical protein ACE5LV_04450 [Candidatus Aminicenantales bacterium]